MTPRIDALLAMCYAIQGDERQTRAWSSAFAATLPDDEFVHFQPDADDSATEQRFREDTMLPAWREAGLPETPR